MLEAIANGILLIILVGILILWIVALTNWDGECHMDCADCPYKGWCDHENKRRKRHG